MKPHVVEHRVFDHKEWKMRALIHLLKKKRNRKRFYLDYVRAFYFDQIVQDSPIPKMTLEEIVGSPSLHMKNFCSRNGNVSPYELLCIASLVAQYKPKNLLEIGTFDGNTTLQMALNSPEGSIVHTIDLPPENLLTKEPVLDSDLQFITDEKKQVRKFESEKTPAQIVQHFGDSTDYDFSKFCSGGPLDFVFIDGGHSFACVKSDTENALKVLAENGCIVWHDFTPFFGGVFHYLTELAKQMPLIHIEGTHLVIHSQSNDELQN